MHLQLDHPFRAPLRALAFTLLAAFASAISGCGTSAPPAPPAPANVEAARQQDEAQFAAERQHQAP